MAINVDLTGEDKSPELKRIFYAQELIRNCTGDEDYKERTESKLDNPLITEVELDILITELQMNQPKTY
jgi:hypothetical protein